jgi:hypothetical protein
MSRRLAASFAALLLWVTAPNAIAQWQEVQPGFDFQEFNLAGPVEVFVTRMVTGDPASRAIDSCLGQGQLRPDGLSAQGRETPSAMAARYDDTINYYFQTWGQRSDVIAAINGDFWERESPGGALTGFPTSGQIHSGWFCRRFLGFSGGSGFYWTIWGVPHLGGNVRNGETSHEEHVVIYPDASEEIITEINVERSTDDLVLYTPQWADRTYTDNSGVEVLVRMSRPNIPLPSPFSASGTIVEIRDGQGSTLIPFDHVVLSGHGTAAAALLSRSVVGDVIGIRTFLKDYGKSGTPPLPSQDWTKAYGSVGGDRYLVIDSQIPTNSWPTNRDPRTAVAFNNDHVFFVVADGRSAQSIGMSFAELADFCLNTLSATHTVAQDGGGSSALWVEGMGVVNTPSDGSERATHNGLMMVAVEPRIQSSTFGADNVVEATQSTSVRLGPGSNYQSVDALSAGELGTVVDHGLNGVLATGQSWWKCDFGGTEGWVTESALTGVSAVSGQLFH